MDQKKAIVVLQNATRMLAEVKNSSDAKKLMDVASAAEHYAKKAKLGQEAINHAHSIKIQAMTLLGRFLEAAPKNDGAKGIGTSAVTKENRTPTLSDIGLTKKESSEAQFLHRVASEEPDTYEDIKSGKKSISEVKREIKKEELTKEIQEFPSKKYRVIYADPPWSYNDKCDEGSIQSGGVEKHYPSMTIDQLCFLPVNLLIDENAVLFLWVTSPLLFECLPIIKAWGF